MSTTPATEPVITSYALAPTKTVHAAGTTFAFRELGPKEEIPVVFFVHLAATLDNWDPRIVDAIAANRHVIAFDQRGVGASTGTVPGTLEEAADDAVLHGVAPALGELVVGRGADAVADERSPDLGSRSRCPRPSL